MFIILETKTKPGRSGVHRRAGKQLQSQEHPGLRTNKARICIQDERKMGNQKLHLAETRAQLFGRQDRAGQRVSLGLREAEWWTQTELVSCGGVGWARTRQVPGFRRQELEG